MSSLESFVRAIQDFAADGIPSELAIPLVVFLFIALRGAASHWSGDER